MYHISIYSIPEVLVELFIVFCVWMLSLSLLWMCYTHQMPWNGLKIFTFVGIGLWNIFVHITAMLQIHVAIAAFRELFEQWLKTYFSKDSKP